MSESTNEQATPVEAEEVVADAVDGVVPVDETAGVAAEAAEGDEGDEEPRDEGDIAADYIEDLLDISDVDGDLDIEERDGRMYVSVSAEGESNLDRLADPETVEALQHLTRLAVQAETGEFSRLILDIGGSRATRERELETLVARAAARIEEGAASAALPPMSSYERKLVHDLVKARGLTSESEGEGRDRHTVIKPVG